jgi:hypothetical protein
MRAAPLVLALALAALPGVAAAQDPGFAVNLGSGLDRGASLGWTFKENWTLQPTIGAGYSQQTGVQASIGSTVLRSFGYGHRVYGYVGAGAYFGTANTGSRMNQPAPLAPPSNSNLRGSGSGGSIAYVSTPIGLRVRITESFEAYAEGAYQRTLTGAFGLNQSGQFYGGGSGRERLGGSVGITMRLN